MLLDSGGPGQVPCMPTWLNDGCMQQEMNPQDRGIARRDTAQVCIRQG
jgi:hypothetical protein